MGKIVDKLVLNNLKLNDGIGVEHPKGYYCPIGAFGVACKEYASDMYNLHYSLRHQTKPPKWVRMLTDIEFSTPVFCDRNPLNKLQLKKELMKVADFVNEHGWV